MFSGEGITYHEYERKDYLRKQLFKNRKEESNFPDDTSFILGYGLFTKNSNSSECDEQFYCGFISDHDINCMDEKSNCPSICKDFLPETHKCVVKECNEEFFCCNFSC